MGALRACGASAPDNVRNRRDASSVPANLLPADRIVAVIDRLHETNVQLAERTGQDEARFRHLRNQRTITLAAADRLLVALGLEYLWFAPAPEGLADLYGEA